MTITNSDETLSTVSDFASEMSIAISELLGIQNILLKDTADPLVETLDLYISVMQNLFFSMPDSEYVELSEKNVSILSKALRDTSPQKTQDIIEFPEDLFIPLGQKSIKIKVSVFLSIIAIIISSYSAYSNSVQSSKEHEELIETIEQSVEKLAPYLESIDSQINHSEE